MRKQSTNAKIAEAVKEGKRFTALAALRATLPKHPEVRETLQRLPLAARRVANMGVSTFENSLSITITTPALDGFKTDKRLLRILDAMAGLDGWEASTNDYGSVEYGPARTYTFLKKVPWEHTNLSPRNLSNLPLPTFFTLRLSVYAYVRSDSPTCRVVVTGVEEKMVRTEKTEIVCD